jgi:hypothetical protein
VLTHLNLFGLYREKVYLSSKKHYGKSFTLFFEFDGSSRQTHAHDLADILFIATASIICGAESWYDMEEFSKAKRDWLSTFLRLPGGMPSHGTFNCVFPPRLEKGFPDRTGR